MGQDRLVAEDSGGRRRSRRRATARQGPPPPAAVPGPDDAAAQGSPATAPSDTEAIRSEAIRSEAIRSEAIRSEAIRSEAIRSEAGGTEPTGPGRTPRARRENRSGAAGAKVARGDRDLAGSGSSQVGPTGAMRARDLNRPTPEDLAEAEAELDIVRRHWVPTTEQAETRPARRRRS